MNIFYDFLSRNKSFRTLEEHISGKRTPVLVSGVIGAQKSHVMAGLIAESDKSSLIVTSSELKAKEICSDLSFFMDEKPLLYPAKDVIFYWADVKSLDIVIERFNIIKRLLNGEKITVVLSAEALLDRLILPEKFHEFVTEINTRTKTDMDELSRKLVLMGYERCDMVEGPGQFAVRGGIVDIYPSTSENAYRLEFWGDEIDSIRVLDTVSQRSVENAPGFTLYPIRELVYGEENIEKAVENIKKELDSLKDPSDKLKIETEAVIEKFRTQKSFSGVEKYICYLYDQTASILDYFNDALVFVDDPNRVSEHCDFVMNEFTTSMESRIEKDYMLPSQLNVIYKYEEIAAKIQNCSTVLLTSLMSALKDYSPKELVSFDVKEANFVKNDMNLIAEDLGNLCRMDYKVIFLAGGHSHCQRILSELQERELKAVYAENINEQEIRKGIVYVTRGSLSHGFEYAGDKFAVLTETDAFGDDIRKRHHAGRRRRDGAAIQSVSDLKTGDYVVHENHGIGIFRGVEQLVTDGVRRDFIKICYAEDDILYVSINQMDMVQKYIGGETSKPKLNKLGGKEWRKAKAKAKKAAYISAKELVELYAQRQKTQGFRYSPDTIWQKEFEEDFEFEETEDQLISIAEIKQDMEAGKIMDRLLCGDVGFGKTEVAMRAAFKTVADGRQVAYLVPTTILASQHFTTFTQRMEKYPINIEMLSRFRTQKQQNEIIRGLKKGTIDIVIGTHRLLSSDVEFKNLGLVIIDEEQRFGVRHKDKLKELRKNVNVLTLSATPIPRTMHMSLMGIRDMSVLTEPPENRIPIQTYVMDYDEASVRDAIYRELSRNGQVYFLHNRVANIIGIAGRLRKLVPEARICYAHGQMSQRELENIMMEFIAGEYDVLVCTTIIETGLDIPNVNTIIISDADRMGLSQLYQLRGRVGRSTRTSYAYLMYAKDKILSIEAEKRLQTIKEFTEFGSGFRVAMKDLEIRGAGNLLGSEQHGHMEAVGYELYCKLINDAVAELQGGETEQEFETLMDIKLNAYIPNSYISSEEQRIEMYKKISLISSLEDYYDVKEELEDRYGVIPSMVINLLDVAYLKSMAHKLGATSVKHIRDKVIVYFRPDAKLEGTALMKAVNLFRGRIFFTNSGENPYLTYTLTESRKVLDETRDLLDCLSTA